MTNLHGASLEISMRTGGKVRVDLSQARAAELLDWLAPVLEYLRKMAEEEANASV